MILVSGQCQINQQSTLIHLKNKLLFDSSLSTKLVSWNPNTTDCCTWGGVTCSITGQVIGLDMSNETISGGIDDSSVLFNLKNLGSLNLAANNFHFRMIPSRFGNLGNLLYLNLSSSGFSGQVPGELSQLTRLDTQDISDNKFSGGIPRTIGRLKALYYLNVSHNEFTDSIPSSVGDLSKLESLDMSSNKLTGEIPYSLTRLSFLSYFNLSYNQLQGRIPTGKQLETFGNGSYVGNEGLCGFPLSRACTSSVAPVPNYAPSSH